MKPQKKVSKKKLRIGLIGCGGICRYAHAPAWKSDERAEIVAVCDILPDRAKELAKDFFPKAATTTDYRELLKRKDIDAVDICTPNDLHSEIAIAAFAAGKHVFCEKPDAISPAKALEMKKASEKAGKLLMVMRNNRFTEAAVIAKSFIEQGKMGEIYAGRCGWQRRRGSPGRGGWFTTKAKSGGGPLIDLGVHMIDLAVWLMGNPRPVAVSGNTWCKFAEEAGPADSAHSVFGDVVVGGTFDVEDLAMGMIRFDNGTVLQIEFSWSSNVKAETKFVQLRGTQAGLSWRDGKLEFYTEERGQLLDIVPAGTLKDEGHRQNLRNFVDTILGVAKPCYLPQQGVDMIKILSAIYDSAKTGREVTL